MLPLAAAMMLTLLALCWFCFPAKRLSYQSSDMAPSWQPKLVWSCLGLYLVFLTALEMNQALWGLALVLLGFLILARAVIVHVDWSLLLVFMVMFIDVHLLTQLPALHRAERGRGALRRWTVADRHRPVAGDQQCALDHSATQLCPAVDPARTGG